MIVLKLLKFYTGENSLRIFILTLLTISLIETGARADSDGELAANKEEVLEVAAYKSCNQIVEDAMDVEKDLNQACSEANLGSQEACIQTLRECESEDDAKNNEECLEGMTMASDIKLGRKALDELKEKETALKEQIQEQQGNIADYEQQALEIRQDKDKSRAALDQALAEIGTRKAEFQRQENESLEKLESAVDDFRNKLVTLELRFRGFILSQVERCHAQAENHRRSYVQAAQRGLIKYSSAKLFGMAGLSVQDRARKQGEMSMRRCMSMRNSRQHGNKITPYGRRYRLERERINLEKKMFNKAIRHMEAKKQDVKKAHYATLASLSQAERVSIAQNQRDVLRLNHAGVALIKREQAAIQKIQTLQFQSLALMSEIHSKENDLQKKHGDDIKIASNDTVKAYKKAHSLIQTLHTSAYRAEGVAANCNAQATVADMLRRLGIERNTLIADAKPDADEETDAEAKPAAKAKPADDAKAADDEKMDSSILSV